jgi:hypothetical protein
LFDRQKLRGEDNMMTLRHAAVGLTLGVGAIASASAQSTWNFGDVTPTGSCAETANAGAMGNVWGCSVQPAGTTTTLEVRAFGNTGTGGVFAAANVGYNGTGSGFGVKNTTEGLAVAAPNHSMDNDTSADALLLKFTNGPMALNSVTLGWTQNDSDLTILRWVGTGGLNPLSGTGAITADTVGTLIASGWELVSSLSNIGTTTTGFNAGKLTSSYWLISAYNSTWSGAGDANLDYVKVLAVGAAGPTGVPEPTTAALVGLALFGFAGSRRGWFKRG